MTIITLEVPDELASRLAALGEELPELLAAVLALYSEEGGRPEVVEAMRPAYEQVIDFLVGGPSPAEILAFKVSPPAEARLAELLENEGEDGLSEVEEAELDIYQQLNSFFILLKARARQELLGAN